MPELLLELLSEEIPARMQDRAANDLADLLAKDFQELGLDFKAPIRRYATPRRLTVAVEELATRQADRMVERKGPKVDAPEAARAGFLRSLEGVSFRLEEREDRRGRTLFALVEERGRATAELLAERLPELLGKFPWPKSMRWGSGEVRWVRPLQSILSLFDGAVVPFEFAGIASGAETRGHRFMAPESFTVRNFDDYVAKLRAAKVVLDGAERRQTIREVAEDAAREKGLRLRHDEALLDEVKGLVEWAVPLRGSIDASFMDLPPEVLVTTMRTHQRYLALEDAEGKLASDFILIANIEADDGGTAIMTGNERVLRARLWDAKFFWEQDKQKRLESLLPKLDSVVFHAELGTQGERVARLRKNVDTVATCLLSNSNVQFLTLSIHDFKPFATKASELAKADLASGLVGEFPELQGIIGRHVAESFKEPKEVAQAIADQYSPKGDEKVPTGSVSIAVALADRLDTLVGFFAKGIRPTGSKDPFALRRAALGIIRLILDNSLRISLRQLLGGAISAYGARLEGADEKAVIGELLAFFADRLKVHLRGQGIHHDLITAVFATGDDDLVRLVGRVRALQEFLATDDGTNLLAGYNRASNIIGIEEKRDKRAYHEAPNRDLLREAGEQDLYRALEAAEETIVAALKREDFGGAMAALARLRRPIDTFFDTVLVNAPEPELQVNRLRMLNRIRTALDAIADFSRIEDTPKAA